VDNVVADCPAEDLVDAGAAESAEPGRSDAGQGLLPADAEGGADLAAEGDPARGSAATAATGEAEVTARVVEFAVRASAPPAEAGITDPAADEDGSSDGSPGGGWSDPASSDPANSGDGVTETAMSDPASSDPAMSGPAISGPANSGEGDGDGPTEPDAGTPIGDPPAEPGLLVAPPATEAQPDPPDRAAPAADAGPVAATMDDPDHDDANRDDATQPAAGRLGRRRARRGPNKREVRHQQTREAIVDAAAALFSERGFDAVSVQQIARRAGVVEKTVFNHFPVKEGLVFEADPPMRAALLEAVRRRPAGESAAAAAGSFLVAAISQLGSPAAAAGVAEMARVVRGSRTLQVREREILGMLTDSLAEQIARETRAAAGDLQPWLAAHAALGLYSALLELARDRVLAGVSGPGLVAELRAQGERGVALLQFGLAGYAKRR
jgi:AcrR family transcriptional regulator